MAAAIGLAASIIAVIEITTKVAALSYGYISGVKKGPGTIKKLADELKSFNTALTTLQIGVQGPSGAPGSSATLHELDDPLRRCTEELKKWEDKLAAKTKKSPGLWRNIMARSQWPFEEKETLEFIVKIERYKSLFTLVLGTDQLSRSRVIETNVQGARADIQTLAARSTAHWDIEKQNEVTGRRIKILNWLHSEAFDKRHMEISRRRKRGTGQWVLKAQEVMDWISNGKASLRLLWGFGIPGAGKTFLSSLLIDYLLGKASAANYGVAYIYFNFKEQDRQTPIKVLASLIKQLACQIQQDELPKEITDLHEKLERDQKSPTLEDLYSILLVVVKSFTQTFIVCDALDECNPQTQRRELLPLFHRMCKDMSLFLTSREYPEDIQDAFKNYTKLRLWAKDEDIANYIGQKIAENPRAERLVGKESDCKDRIISGLQDCAKGMFLLVHFHIEYLCKQTTRRQILEELDKLKSSSNDSEINPMDPTYNRAMEILRAQPKNCVDLAFKILSWLTKARRVLTVRELQLAVSVEKDRTIFDEQDLPDRKTMLDVCASLVTIDEKGDTVRLIHYTTQEYILRNTLLPKDADFYLAMSSITFLSFDLFAQGPCTSDDSLAARCNLYPFLQYAADYLPFHLKKCDEALTTGLVLRFVRSMGTISSYLQLKFMKGPYLRYDRFPGHQTALHVAATLGNTAAVQLLLEINVDIKDSQGRTALLLAASLGHESTVKLLLDKGADTSAADEDGWTALLWAASSGHEPTVKLLLDKGADISAADEDGWTALLWAASSGHESTVKLLLDKGADTSAADEDGWTVLLWAASKGHESTVKLLLDKGADTSAADRSGRTALLWAASKGHESTVKLLLDKGADTSAADRSGRTALLWAASKGHESTVKLLLDKGADTSAADRSGRTALLEAAPPGQH